MTNETGISKDKRISEELRQKIDSANRHWGKSKEVVLDVYHQALADGWTSIEAGDICREKLTIFSATTIKDILPDDAKHQEKKRLATPKVSQIAYKEVEAEPPMEEPTPKTIEVVFDPAPIDRLSDRTQVFILQIDPVAKKVIEYKTVGRRNIMT